MNAAYVSGGGILNIEGNPTYANLKLINDQAGWGGGIANYDGSPLIRDVVFVNDTSPLGGAVYNDGTGSFSGLSWVNPYSISATPVFMRDSFAHCFTSFSGGGIENYVANIVMDWVTFYENTAKNYGGGLTLDNTTATISHTKFIGNQVYDTVGGALGGAISCDANNGATITLTDVLFAKNIGGPGWCTAFRHAGVKGMAETRE